jgi:hypothetical protein
VDLKGLAGQAPNYTTVLAYRIRSGKFFCLVMIVCLLFDFLLSLLSKSRHWLSDSINKEGHAA